MKVYFMFDIKEEYIKLYEDNERVLYNILKQVYYLEKEEVSFGYNILNQLVNRIEKQILDQFIFIKLHQTIPYSKRNNTHYLNNLYKNEISRLKIKNAYIKLETEQNSNSFFNILGNYYKNFFVCDFSNQEYFFLSKVKTLV